MPDPVVVASDDFERADESPLAAPWTAVSGSSLPNLTSGKAQNFGGGSVLRKFYYGNSETYADNQWQFHAGSTGSLQYVGVRMDAARTSGYILYPGNRSIYRRDTGTDTLIASSSVGETFYFEADGTTLRAYGDKTKTTNENLATDATYSSGAPDYLQFYFNTAYFDSWEGGDLGEVENTVLTVNGLAAAASLGAPLLVRGFPAMDFSAYGALGRWRIDRWVVEAGRLVLRLKEWRSRLQRKIPAEIYTLADFPQLDPNAEGSRRPIVYGSVVGAPCYLVNLSTSTFEVAGHAILRFDGLYADGQPIAATSTDEANGRFTWMGWTDGTVVTADFTGAPDGAVALANPADVVEDLLTTWGGEPAASLDATAFAAARAEWVLGVDSRGREVHRPAVSLWIGDETEILDVLGDLMGAVRGLLWVSSEGLYTLRAWAPEPLEGIEALDDNELFDCSDSREVAKPLTRSLALYRVPAGSLGGDGQAVEQASTAHRAARGLPDHATETRELPFIEREDARLWAGYEVATRGRPQREVEVDAAGTAALLEPGDTVCLDSTRYGLTGPWEVLEIRRDPAEGPVGLVLSDRRGLGDGPGYWTDDAPTLPTRHGGATVTAWDAAWTDEVARWARENLGFWTDDHGLIDATDARSFEGSVYV